MLARALALTLTLTLWALLPGPAGAVERLGWDDLIPAWQEPEDPLRALTPAQQKDVVEIFWVRNLLRRGSPPEKLEKRETEARARLLEGGVDVDALLAEIEAMRTQAEAQNSALVGELNGREVQIPGYALPLEFSGTAMTEFLLVPYVGACIHTPPPPANQIVLVRSPQGVESDGLFTPVWVTGRMSTVSSTQSLSFVDGVSDVSVGYGLDASAVEPYEE